MSDDGTNDAQIASQVLNSAGQFAFIFPGAGQIAGAVFSFVGGLIGLAADRQADPGPSMKDLDDDIKAVGKLVAQKFKELDEQGYRTLLTTARTDETTLAETFDKIAADPKKHLLQAGDIVPPPLAAALKLDLDLGGDGTPLSQVCDRTSSLVDPAERAKALVVYCDARTRLHSYIQKNLFIYQEAMLVNNRFGEKPSAWTVPAKWWEADILATPLQVSLRTAIAYAEPTLQSLKHSYRTRLDRANAAASPSGVVPGIARKEKWDDITSSEHLDQISEAAVDKLLGTDTRMGVVELWKESLQTLFGERTGTKAFDRGDKLDPVRQVPTCWLNKADVDAVANIAIGKPGAGNTLDYLTQKQKSVLGDNDRPFVGAIRSVGPDVKMLTIVVVNTTDDPLLLLEPLWDPVRMISKPAVADYPALLESAKRSTAGWTAIENAGSADPTSWIDAAPVAQMGPGSASVGVWQFGLAPSEDAVTVAMKFGPFATTQYEELYIGAELRTDRHNNVILSADMAAADQGSTRDFFTAFRGQGSPSSDAAFCHATVTPDGSTNATNDTVVTVLVS